MEMKYKKYPNQTKTLYSHSQTYLLHYEEQRPENIWITFI